MRANSCNSASGSDRQAPDLFRYDFIGPLEALAFEWFTAVTLVRTKSFHSPALTRGFSSNPSFSCFGSSSFSDTLSLWRTLHARS